MAHGPFKPNWASGRKVLEPIAHYAVDAQCDPGMTEQEAVFLSQFADPNRHHLPQMAVHQGMPLQKTMKLEITFESGRKGILAFRRL